MFFFEKKNEKTFIHCGRQIVGPYRPAGDAISKRFLLLFFKKERLPSFVGPATRRRGALVPDLR
jgi:hypothetical protein